MNETEEPSPRMPRWVMVSTVIAGVLIMIVIAVMVLGGHGPGGHG